MAYKDIAKKTAYQNEFIKQAYDRINLTVPKGRKAELQAEAERRGQSVNGFINSLIDEALDRDSAGASPAAGGAGAGGAGAGTPAAAGGAGGAGSPEGTDTGGRGFGFSADVQPEHSIGRFITQSAPDFQTAPEQESFVDIFKRLGAMPKDELEKQLGLDPESIERKRQRLAELNAKGNRLSEFEERERRRLMEIFNDSADSERYGLLD